MRVKLAALALVAGLGLAVSGCSSTNNPYIPPTQAHAAPKGVYIMTNAPGGNAIAFYRRAADGSLTYVDSYATGGDGSGMSLQSQGSLVFNPDLNLFFCVNAGNGVQDGSVSMLRLNDDGSLTLLSHIDSGGVNPISLTQTSQTLVVLNAGDGTNTNPANITAFSITGGQLATYPAAQDNASLSAGAVPAEVSFTPGGRNVVVTEKFNENATTPPTPNGSIDVFGVDQNGHGFTTFNNSHGAVPYGFAFGPNGHLLVSEADGGESGDGAASSYSINSSTGVLTNISPSVDSGGKAACWLTVAGNFAYVTNAGSGNVAQYDIGNDGSLAFESTFSTGVGTAPLDEDATDGNDFLYVLDYTNNLRVARTSGSTQVSQTNMIPSPTIGYFPIKSNGSLGTLQTYTTNLPASAEGLVAR